MATLDLDSDVFIENSSRLRAAAAARYPGEHVAWSFDGTTILAHSLTIDGLIDDTRRLGIVDYVADYLLPPDELLVHPFLGSIPAVAAHAKPGN